MGFVFSLSVLLFTAQGLALPSVSANDRPLRTLDISSEVYVHIDSDIRTGQYYQNGKSVVPPLDESIPYCRVDEISQIPDLENRKTPLALNRIEGSYYDEGVVETLGSKFLTTMSFSNPSGELDIQCAKESDNVFNEITLGEFEAIFSGHLRFGNLQLADTGIEMNSMLYSEHHVLTPQVLRNQILLRTEQELVLHASDDSYTNTIVAGKWVGADHSFENPYCSFYIIEEIQPEQTQITIPAQQTFGFGAVSGSYMKLEGLDFGFSTMMDLTGFTKPVRLQCSSANSNQPLRYLQMRYITLPYLDWIYTLK